MTRKQIVEMVQDSRCRVDTRDVGLTPRNPKHMKRLNDLKRQQEALEQDSQDYGRYLMRA
jgi:hypothetical protein